MHKRKNGDRKRWKVKECISYFTTTNRERESLADRRPHISINIFPCLQLRYYVATVCTEHNFVCVCVRACGIFHLSCIPERLQMQLHVAFSAHAVYQRKLDGCDSCGTGNLLVWFWEEPKWPLGFQRPADWIWAQDGSRGRNTRHSH